MKKFLKTLVAVALMLCLSAMPILTASAEAVQEDNGVMPCFNNTFSVFTNMGINNNGEMVITYDVTGYPDIAYKIVIVTYIEKKTLGIFWTRVDNGHSDKQWCDTIYDYDYTSDRHFQLSSTGTYRVKVFYTIYGSGGSADEIEYVGTDTY